MPHPARTALVVVLLLVCSGCSSLPGFGPDPLAGAEDYAAGVARALTAGDPTLSPELAQVLGDLTETEREVRLTEVVEAPESSADEVAAADRPDAIARLAWTWSIGAEPWTYTSEVGLRRVDSDGDDWSLIWAPSVVEPTLTDGETLDLRTVRPRRGDILGAGDLPLVTLRDVVRFGVDKSQVSADEALAVAREVADRVGVARKPFVQRVRNGGERQFVQAVVLRAEDAEPILRDGSYDALKGAAALGTRMPLAPTKEFAAPILGSYGEATAELIEKSEGRLRVGDSVGLSGLQARYEERLAGSPGTEVHAVAPDGTSRELHVDPIQEPVPLRTSLDYDAQLLAESLLSQVGPASALVAVRPSDGHVLAAASGPGSAGYNTATAGQYAPGSTFKVITALALLRSGLKPGSPVQCAPTITVDGKRFKNYDDYPAAMQGRVTLRQAFAHSCNTALIAERARLGDGDLADAAAALGFGVDHDTGFPAYFGQVPAAESETEAAAALIGQGKVLASPLAMALVAASVVAGESVLPSLVLDHSTEPTTPANPLTDAEARQLRQLLRAVVDDGSGRFLGDLPGQVLAKTGTAEYGDGSSTHAWMIGARGDLAVAVFVETGASGSRTAGPILREFLRRAG